MAYQNGYVLTGGIATGKSTVCSLLRIQGFSIVDADVIAREVLESSKAQIIKVFGPSILTDNLIDRKKLGSVIFADEEKREQLNAIMHPQIRAKIEMKAKELDKKGVPFILDIPLYFESGEYKAKMAVVVYTPKEIQLQRLCEREGLSEEEATKRVASQIDIEVKKEQADWVIDNSGNLKHLQAEVEKFVEFVRGEYAGIKI